MLTYSDYTFIQLHYKVYSGRTKCITSDYLVGSVDEDPMEEIRVYQTWKTLEYAV